MEIRTGKDSVAQRYGFRSGGGRNHVRYDHKIRPTSIDVICPNCQGLAVASDLISKEGSVLCVDMSASWNGKPFGVVCTKCTYKSSGSSYAELPPPFHQIYVFGRKLWAWNSGHLNMIYLFLGGADIREHPYARLATYIHGDWKKKSRKFIREIERHVEKSANPR